MHLDGLGDVVAQAPRVGEEERCVEAVDEQAWIRLGPLVVLDVSVGVGAGQASQDGGTGLSGTQHHHQQ